MQIGVKIDIILFEENIPFRNSTSVPFHIVDYGTGDGGTTIDLMNYAIGEYTEVISGKSIIEIRNFA